MDIAAIAGNVHLPLLCAHSTARSGKGRQRRRFEVAFENRVSASGWIGFAGILEFLFKTIDVGRVDLAVGDDDVGCKDEGALQASDAIFASRR